MPCSLVVQLARVSVRVILVDVVCVMLVLIARVDIRAVYVQFSYPFFVVEDVLFTPPSVTVNCVDCYRNDHCNFAPNSL